MVGGAMKVKGYEIFKCDAGWRTCSFLKFTTDTGPIGWSEYNESFGSPGLSAVIENLMTSVIGMDPMDLELVNAVLATKSTQSRGGVVRQAIAAIQNALLDIKGKALCAPGSPPFCGTPAVKGYEDFSKTGEGVRAKGFTACKTNIAIEVDGKLRAYRPGFVVGKGFPERNWDAFIARSAAKTVEAFRKGCGPDVGVILDTNFHFRTEGFRQIAEAVGPPNLTSLHLDVHDPPSLPLLRRDSPCP